MITTVIANGKDEYNFIETLKERSVSGAKDVTDIVQDIINNVKYDYIYSWFDKAYKSLEPDPVWFEKEILEKV